MKKSITVNFYKNIFSNEIEAVDLIKIKGNHPIENLSKVLQCLDDNLPENLEGDEWYEAKLVENFEPTGAGGSILDGYTIASIKCCTKII